MSAELARTFVSLILVLALIVGILLIVRKLGVGGRIGLPSDKSQDIQVQSVRPLPGGGALYLVRALDRIVLIGATPQGGLRLLTEWLEADVPARARETAGTTPPTPDLGRTSPESPSAQKGPGA
jgi:flagellar biogenesis protein FliO